MAAPVDAGGGLDDIEVVEVPHSEPQPAADDAQSLVHGSHAAQAMSLPNVVGSPAPTRALGNWKAGPSAAGGHHRPELKGTAQSAWGGAPDFARVRAAVAAANKGRADDRMSPTQPAPTMGHGASEAASSPQPPQRTGLRVAGIPVKTTLAQTTGTGTHETGDGGVGELLVMDPAQILMVHELHRSQAGGLNKAGINEADLAGRALAELKGGSGRRKLVPGSGKKDLSGSQQLGIPNDSGVFAMPKADGTEGESSSLAVTAPVQDVDATELQLFTANAKHTDRALRATYLARVLIALGVLPPARVQSSKSFVRWASRLLFALHTLVTLVVLFGYPVFEAVQFFRKGIHDNDANTANASIYVMILIATAGMLYARAVFGGAIVHFDRIAAVGQNGPRLIVKKVRRERAKRAQIAMYTYLAFLVAVCVVSFLSLGLSNAIKSAMFGTPATANATVPIPTYVEFYHEFALTALTPSGAANAAILVIAIGLGAAHIVAGLEFILLVFFGATVMSGELARSIKELVVYASKAASKEQVEDVRYRLHSAAYYTHFHSLVQAKLLAKMRRTSAVVIAMLLATSITCVCGLSTESGLRWQWCLVYTVSLLGFAQFPVLISRAEHQLAQSYLELTDTLHLIAPAEGAPERSSKPAKSRRHNDAPISEVRSPILGREDSAHSAPVVVIDTPRISNVDNAVAPATDTVSVRQVASGDHGGIIGHANSEPARSEALANDSSAVGAGECDATIHAMSIEPVDGPAVTGGGVFLTTLAREVAMESVNDFPELHRSLPQPGPLSVLHGSAGPDEVDRKVSILQRPSVAAFVEEARRAKIAGAVSASRETQEYTPPTYRETFVEIATTYGRAIQAGVVMIVYAQIFSTLPYKTCINSLGYFVTCRQGSIAFLWRLLYVATVHVGVWLMGYVCFPKIARRLAARALLPTLVNVAYVGVLFGAAQWNDYTFVPTFLPPIYQLYDMLMCASRKSDLTGFREPKRVLRVFALRILVAVAILAIYGRICVRAIVSDSFAVVLTFRIVAHTLVTLSASLLLRRGVLEMGSLPAGNGTVLWYWISVALSMIGRLMMFKSRSVGQAFLMNALAGAIEIAIRRSYFARNKVLNRLTNALRPHFSRSRAVASQQPIDLAALRAQKQRTFEVYAGHLAVETLVEVQSAVAALVLVRIFRTRNNCYLFDFTPNSANGGDAIQIANVVLMLTFGFVVDYGCMVWEQKKRIDVTSLLRSLPTLPFFLYTMACGVLVVHLTDWTFVQGCGVG